MPTTLRLSTITDAEDSGDAEDTGERLPRVHPGEFLLEDFLKPLGMSQYRLARALGVPPRRINEIVRGRRSITGDTALRLGQFFGVSPVFWLNLQTRFELDVAMDRAGEEIARTVKRLEWRKDAAG